MKGPIKHWTPAEESKLRELKSKGVGYPDIAALMGRSIKSCRSRAEFLHIRNPPKVKPVEVPGETITVAPIAPAKPQWKFTPPEKRRCMREGCRQWFKVTYTGQYFCIGHRPSDDTGMLERSANYRTPARMSF